MGFLTTPIKNSNGELYDYEIHYGAIFFTLIGAIILITILSTSVAIMGTGKVGVVTSFNKVTGRELTDGFNLKAPWPFQQVHDFDVRIQKEQVEASAASQDLQQVNATLAVNYHLDRMQVSKIYQTLGTDYKIRVIDPAIQETFKATTTKFTANDLLAKRSDVAQQAEQTLSDKMGKYGIIIDSISVVNFDFSKQFNDAIEAKQVAQQQAQQAKYDADKATQEAQAEINRAQGSAEAQRLQQQTLTPELLQKYAIDKWDGKMPQYVGSGSIFNIPLTK